MPHWFTITGHDLNLFTWWFTVSSLMGMVCVVWSHALFFHAYWAGFVLFHLILHWLLLTWHGLYYFTSCFTGLSLLSMIVLASFDASLVLPYWVWLLLFHFLLPCFFPHWFILFGLGWHWFTSCFKCSSLHLFYFMLPRFIISRHGFYLLTYCLTGSSFLGMVCIASLHASHVHHYWEWFVLDHFMLHWFIITGLGWHWFTSCFTWSSLLGRVCIVSLDALLVICKLCIAWLSSLVHHYCAWFAMFHVMLFRFYLTGHGLHYFSFLTGTSLLGMVCIVSLHASLVLTYWPWLVLFHLMRHWLLLTWHGLYYFTSCFTGLSLLSMIVIASFDAWLVLPYWVWLLLFHFLLPWLIITGHAL